MNKEKNILVVARWPLGGIRTYMRYMFRSFPDHYNITILAASTQENDALQNDADGYGATLLLAEKSGAYGLTREVMSVLKKRPYDVILSQGFISAVAVYFANLMYRIPHVLTIHGVVEDRYLTGRFAWAKLQMMEKVLAGITVHYAVSNDILAHLYEQFPRLKHNKVRSIVIPNGIDMNDFVPPQHREYPIRKSLGIPEATFLFGFFGRFMQQKGFDLLIEAVDRLLQEGSAEPFAVLAVGSGDYLDSYKKTVSQRKLDKYFFFQPFQAQVKDLYLEVNAIVMPSRWEACPLQPMEALSMGIPMIASNCIGLRETVSDTPASIFPSESVSGLSDMMRNSMLRPRYAEFSAYTPTARRRYDIAESAKPLVRLIAELSESQQTVIVSP